MSERASERARSAGRPNTCTKFGESGLARLLPADPVRSERLVNLRPRSLPCSLARSLARPSCGRRSLSEHLLLMCVQQRQCLAHLTAEHETLLALLRRAAAAAAGAERWREQPPAAGAAVADSDAGALRALRRRFSDAVQLVEVRPA